MGAEVCYLLATLGKGIPTVPLCGSRFWRKNSKTVAKFKKRARKFKKVKKISPLRGKNVFFGEGSFIQCKFSPAARGGVGTC